ncbi:MAG: signal peptide peptidase SppA [Gammaproteobacteria bacterium]|nr:MAG: signal peptide peptidase SppA [Gammaproteobacteria bacterium]
MIIRPRNSKASSPKTGDNFNKKPSHHPSRMNDEWYKKTVDRLVFASLDEQKKQRKWKIVFKFLFLFYFIVSTVIFIVVFFDKFAVDLGDHTAIVDVKGIIVDGEPASADNINLALTTAFEDKNTKAVILDINSPGGSPVQSALIYQHIKKLRKKYPKIPIYAVASDVCASGSYYIAAATDKIFANESSIIGSIGVRMDGFGAVNAINKLGITRRLMTAGKNKSMLDPFLPIDQHKKQHMQQVLNQIHQQFIKDVKKGRGKKLTTNSRIFSGLYWTGNEALKLGLIDKLADKNYVLSQIIKEENTVNFTLKEDLLSRLGQRVMIGIKSLIMDNNINIR